ncbi:MAG: hypothetical protein ABEI57_02190 [Halapricum sp.]
MTKFSDLPMVDRLAMGLGGGLIVLGVVVLGIVELLAGHANPMYHGTVNGQAVSALTRSGLPDGTTNVVSPIVPPNVRAGIVVLGLFVLFVYAVYVLIARRGVGSREERTATSMTD